MPHNREPAVYQGSVISLIGVQAGTEVVMDYKNAQACVSSGTHRWLDDETDLPHPIQERVAERTAEQAATDEANRIAMELKAKGGATNVEQLLAERAGKIYVGVYINDDGKDVEYLRRPFPAVALFSKALLDADKDEISIIVDSKPEDVAQDGDIVVKLSNAIARYRPLGESHPLDADDGADSATIIAQLQDDVVQPDVEIPADWQKRHFLQNIAAAKLIMGTTAKMKKDVAEATIEEWTKTDDQVSLDPADAGAGTGEAKTAEGKNEGKTPEQEQGNRDKREFDPAAAAAKAAAELTHDKEND